MFFFISSKAESRKYFIPIGFRYKNRNANELSLKLMDRILSIASEEGSVVFDPFGGAGTSYVAAELTGRRWLGTELNCADILDRFDDLDTDRRYLKQLQLNKNVLFMQADLERRKKSGLPLTKVQATDSAT